MLMYDAVKDLIEEIFEYIEKSQNGVSIIVNYNEMNIIKDYCLNDLNLDGSVMIYDDYDLYILDIDENFNIDICPIKNISDISFYDKIYINFNVKYDYYNWLIKYQMSTEDNIILFDFYI